MTTTHSDSPAVWVLILDRIISNPIAEVAKPGTFDVTEEDLTNAETGRNVFDRLDSESTYFEQFLLQDVREDRADALFGGEASFEKLAEFMREERKSASLVRLNIDDVATPQDSKKGEIESIMRKCRIPLSTVADVGCRGPYETASAAIKMNDIDRALSANLVWIEAHPSKPADPKIATSEILDFVLEKLKSNAAALRTCPWLMVTFRNGLDSNVREPFKSGLDENQIHVPLWIRGNVQHACRVQALAGSFDLLPTITEFLGATNESAASSVPSAKPHDHAAEQSEGEERTDKVPPLSLEPQSLAFLCGAPQICTDRLLKLHGDGWIAVRTEEFLMVIADDCDLPSNETESDGDNSEESSRRLYAKPEDRFNVNDVSGTYVTAAETLARLIQ